MIQLMSLATLVASYIASEQRLQLFQLFLESIRPGELVFMSIACTPELHERLSELRTPEGVVIVELTVGQRTQAAGWARLINSEAFTRWRTEADDRFVTTSDDDDLHTEARERLPAWLARQAKWRFLGSTPVSCMKQTIEPAEMLMELYSRVMSVDLFLFAFQHLLDRGECTCSPTFDVLLVGAVNRLAEHWADFDECTYIKRQHKLPREWVGQTARDEHSACQRLH